MTSRNYLWSVQYSRRFQRARALQSVVNPVQLLMYFNCWNSGSDHCHTCKLFIFIIQLVLRLFYYVCQLSIIACMPSCGLTHLVIINNKMSRPPACYLADVTTRMGNYYAICSGLIIFYNYDIGYVIFT